MRTAGIVAGILLLPFFLLSDVSAAVDADFAASPVFTLQQPTTPAEAPPATATPAPSTAADNDPSTISTVTTYLSTAVLIGAIAWSFWYRRRKAQQRSSNFRM